MRRGGVVMEPPARGPRGTRTIALRSVFSPLSLAAFLFAPLLVLYAVSSESVFAAEFASRKTLSWTGFAYFALAILLFAAVVPGEAGIEAAWTLAVAAAVFVAGRTFAVALGALGWMVFPPEHRALLAELAARAREHE